MKPADKVTVDDYLALEATSDTKHEFVNGEILAMAGASPRHGKIAGNVYIALGTRLNPRGCLLVQSDLRTHVDETGLYAYPDLTVTCDPPQFRLHPRPATLLNPNLVVEVLSHSTEAWDRGAKFAHFRSLASVREYVLVSQSEHRVEVYRRGDDGSWRLFEATGDGTVHLASVDVDLSLVDVYAGADNLPGDDAPLTPPLEP
jgi:Uma2 family endonuclease